MKINKSIKQRQKCKYCNQPLGFTPSAYKNGELICQTCWKIVRYANVKSKNSKECKEYILKRNKKLIESLSHYV